MVTPTLVDIWRQSPSEHQRLEFKEAKSQYDWGKVCEYCVALANEGGGHLLLGIVNKPPRQMAGTAAHSNPIKTAEQLFETLGFRIDVEAVAHSDGRGVVFSIPSRPKGTAYHLEGKYLMRSGEALVAMSEDRLRAIFAEGKPDWLEEHTKIGLNAQDVVEFLDTQTFFELMKVPFPTDRAAVLDRLKADRLIDEDGATFGLRRLGALLLARRLTDFPDLARKTPRVVVYTGRSKVETKLDQLGSKGYAAGFQGLVRFIMSQLPQNEVVKDAIRLEVKLVSEIAIRELVANALIHQDFSIGGASVMVEIYKNRVEVSNPGVPVVPVDRLIDGYQSRNERLADMMRRMGICEEQGSGIDRVVFQAEVFQLPAPDFRVGHQRTTMIVFGPKPFDEMNREERVRACYQHAALRRVMSESMTNQTLRDRFGLPDRQPGAVEQSDHRPVAQAGRRPGPARGQEPPDLVVGQGLGWQTALGLGAARPAPDVAHVAAHGGPRAAPAFEPRRTPDLQNYPARRQRRRHPPIVSLHRSPSFS